MQGVTRIFLTKIPFFREVIVSSFTCEACGMQNAELQPASRIQDKGCIHTVSIQTPQVQLQSMAQVCQSSQVQSMTQISQSSHVQSMTQISQSSQVQSITRISQSHQNQSIEVSQTSQVQTMAQVTHSPQNQSIEVSQTSQAQSIEIDQLSQGDVVFFNVGVTVFVGVSALFWL